MAWHGRRKKKEKRDYKEREREFGFKSFLFLSSIKPVLHSLLQYQSSKFLDLFFPSLTFLTRKFPLLFAPHFPSFLSLSLVVQTAMHDSIAIPACFSSGDQPTAAAPPQPAATVVTRSGQSVFMSVYKTHLAGKPRLITITWCKNLLLHGLSVTVQASGGGGSSSSDHMNEQQHECKVELKPWSFWRKHGSKQLTVDGKSVEVVWDLKSVKFEGETEPRSDYYVAIVCEDEVVLLLGDLKMNAYLRTRCRPALMEPALVSRREHVFGKRRFNTRMKLQQQEKKGGCYHEICLQCNSNGVDHEMEIKVDGKREIEVKHLQWKFRGNESMVVSKNNRVEVYWDVHDWLFGSGPRHGLFIFKPVSVAACGDDEQEKGFNSGGGGRGGSASASAAGDDESGGGSSNNFCLFLYAWKVE